MIFTETALKGAYTITPQRLEDKRGFFARTWSRRDFESRGLRMDPTQTNISFNPSSGTLRGMHWQAPPFGQTKLVRCTMGAIYDVLLDLRRDSPTFRQWLAVELTEDNRVMLFIPDGFAHGFQALRADSEVLYYVSGEYTPEAERGVRWNDPAFGIQWPQEVSVISDRDANYPDSGT